MSNQHHNHDNHAMDTRSFMDKIAFLDGGMRRKILPPEEILQMLPIKKCDSILDAGAGSGYLTIPAAKLTAGTVYALDMDTRMLNVIDRKAKSKNITNIQLIQGSIDAVPLPDGSVDFALASLILHEVLPLSSVFQQLGRIMKTGGHFLCLEYEKEESAVRGPPMHIRIPSREMEQELINAGFSIVKKVFSRESMYIITAKK
jgi:ubiquinone/menaquinone biosynthesis C-methylase UbiE